MAEPIIDGPELVYALAESGTGESKLAIARACLLRHHREGSRASAEDVIREMEESGTVFAATLDKARALQKFGELRAPAVAAGGPPIERVLMEGSARRRSQFAGLHDVLGRPLKPQQPASPPAPPKPDAGEIAGGSTGPTDPTAGPGLIPGRNPTDPGPERSDPLKLAADALDNDPRNLPTNPGESAEANDKKVQREQGLPPDAPTNAPTPANGAPVAVPHPAGGPTPPEPVQTPANANRPGVSPVETPAHPVKDGGAKGPTPPKPTSGGGARRGG